MEHNVANDLSLQQQPISNLFEMPTGSSTYDQFCLSDDQIEHFHEYGYVRGVRILSESQCDALCEQLEVFFDPDHAGHELWHEYHSNEADDPSRVLFHALGAWRIAAGFHDLLWNPAFTVPASQLLDGRVRFWHDQLFCKPAQHGGVVAWHQDYSYWTRTQPMAHLTCWIGLDASDTSNGCLQYIPGSHHWDLLPITGLAGDMTAIRKVLSDDQWEAMQHPEPMILERGEAAFHHPLMVHGSRENHSDRPRRATVINVVRDGVLSDTHEPLQPDVPVIEKGETLSGQFFPLLYDPGER